MLALSLRLCGIIGIVLVATTTQAQKPNIIHIMVDDAGPGDFTSFWAESPVKTPHLDQLAKQGMRFTNAYAGGANCAPSRSALMTGRHLGRAYMRCNAGSIAIRDADLTIAELLKSAGYATAGYGKWGLGPPGSSGAAERQGFDEFVGYYDQVHAHSHYPDRLYDSGKTLLIPENANFNEPETGLVPNSRVHAHRVVFDRMKSFIQKQCEAGAPFYAWGAWTPPHRKSTLNKEQADPGGLYHPYNNRPGWDDFDKIQAGFVTWVDQQVGELRAMLEDPNGDGDKSDSVAGNTLIIFTSDNGGWQSKHEWDRNVETRGGKTVDIRGAKEGYYEGGLRTPMIAYWPGKIQPGSESDLHVAFYDYLPTFAELAGAASSIPEVTDGVSFAPTLSGVGRQKAREGLYFEGYRYNPNSTPTKVARIGDWKLIQSPDGGLQLYDLATDPSETTNRASDTKVEATRRQLLKFIDANHTPIASHLSILPDDVGTGNARRDGVMSFGLRKTDQQRKWSATAKGDAKQFSTVVLGGDKQAIDLHLDDLHMEYKTKLTLKPSGKSRPELAVELVGESGFTYLCGVVATKSLETGVAKTLTVTLLQTGVSPKQDDLASDLGKNLTLRTSHDGPDGALELGEVTLVGQDAVPGNP